MKKNIRFLGFLIFSIALLSNNVTFAQNDEGHVIVTTTNKTIILDGGSAAERDSLMNLWNKNVIRKNK